MLWLFAEGNATCRSWRGLVFFNWPSFFWGGDFFFQFEVFSNRNKGPKQGLNSEVLLLKTPLSFRRWSVGAFFCQADEHRSVPWRFGVRCGFVGDVDGRICWPCAWSRLFPFLRFASTGKPRWQFLESFLPKPKSYAQNLISIRGNVEFSSLSTSQSKGPSDNACTRCNSHGCNRIVAWAGPCPLGCWERAICSCCWGHPTDSWDVPIWATRWWMIGMKSWTHGLYMFVLCVICVLCVLLVHEIDRIKFEKHIVWWLVPISGATPLKLSCWCTAVCNQADRWGDILEFVEAKKDGNWIMLIMLILCITYIV